MYSMTMLEIVRKKVRERVLRWAMQKILLLVTHEEVLKIVDGRVYANGQELRADQARRLLSEVQHFKRSLLFTFLPKLLTYGTQERVLRAGADEKDL